MVSKSLIYDDQVMADSELIFIWFMQYLFFLILFAKPHHLHYGVIPHDVDVGRSDVVVEHLIEIVSRLLFHDFPPSGVMFFTGSPFPQFFHFYLEC